MSNKLQKILIVIGTRPNYIKITRFKEVAETVFPGRFDIKLVHTGQHFDKAMADDFFEQLNITPDHFLNIPAAAPAIQVGEIMIRLEKLLNEFNPDWVIVPGDVNSTVAAALCANKAGYKVAHLESGLRSFDRSMPEEINRIITDEVSDLFFVTEQSGIDNLLKEGKNKDRIHMVGNTMIDTMVHFKDQICNNDITEKLQLHGNEFGLITIHRPATTDNATELKKLCALLSEAAKKIKLVFPIHPRTRKNLANFGLMDELLSNDNIIFSEPLDYLSFQKLIMQCSFVLTDSGGIQEETTFRKIPCLTLRPNTERPITISKGTNLLIPFDTGIVLEQMDAILNKTFKQGEIPEYWDGKATLRILEVFDTQNVLQ